MTKMNPEWRDRWVAALRSGEYKQGKGALCKIEPDGTLAYCCLGVLQTLVAGPGIPNGRKGKEDHLIWQSQGIQENDHQENDPRITAWSVLTPEVYEQVGLEDNNPEVMASDPDDFPYQTSLASLNDSGTDFNTIAQLIEEQL